MADLQVRNGKVVYLDENGDTLYSLPTQVGTPGQSVIFDEDGNLAAGLGLSTLGSLSNVDSTADSAATGKVLSFNGVYWEAVDLSVGGVVFDSAYVQARQDFSYTSLVDTPNILDSDNVETIINADYVTSLGVVGTDSSSVIDIIATTVNNTYVRNRQDFAYGSLTGTPTNVSSFSNDAGYLTSATIGDVIDNTYLDSAEAIAIVNSAYVQARQDYSYSSLTGLPNFFDSTDATTLVDSDYVQARQDYSYQSLIDVPDFFDSADATILVDSDYVQARQDYSYGSLIDVPDPFDSNDATVLVDSDYVRSRQDYSYGSLTDVPDLFDSNDATLLVDSDYVQSRQDDHNLTSDATDTTISANLIPDSDNTRTLGSSTNKFSTVFGAMPVYDSIGALPGPYEGIPGEMAFIPSAGRLFISTGVSWFKLDIQNAAPRLLSVTDSDGGVTPFSLDINGATTIITVEAADSDEEAVLTFSAVADSAFGTFASLSQDDNVFTITPFSIDSAPDAATGSITFSVTDGLVDVSSDPQTFTIDFRPDWSLTTLQQRLVGSDVSDLVSDKLGYAVALSGNTLVAGSRLTDNPSAAGAVYVFTRSGSTWTEQQRIEASDKENNGFFGSSVDIEDDILVVGATNADTDSVTDHGGVYIYTRSGSTWTEQQKLEASDAQASDRFGESVSISGDTLVVGAPYEDTGGNSAGSVYVFTTSDGGSTWTQQQKLQASDPGSSIRFGYTVSLDGDTLAVGRQYADDAFVFTRSGSTWTQQQELSGSGQFGIDISLDGDMLAVGAWNYDSDGINNCGAAYVFTRSGSTWTQQAIVKQSDPLAGANFGYRLALSNRMLHVGAPGTGGANGQRGASYIFSTVDNGSTWTQEIKLVHASPTDGDQFGYDVDIGLDTAIVGVHQDDEPSYTDVGAVHVFTAPFDSA